MIWLPGILLGIMGLAIFSFDYGRAAGDHGDDAEAPDGEEGRSDLVNPYGLLGGGAPKPAEEEEEADPEETPEDIAIFTPAPPPTPVPVLPD